MKYTTKEKFKDFGREVEVKEFTPSSIDDYYKAVPRFGTEWYEGWLSASVISASGKHYAFVRGYERESSNIILTFKMRDDLLDVSSKLIDKLYLGKTFFDKIEGQEAAIIKSPPSKHTFQIELKVNKIHWQEDNGDVDLHYESLGPALSWYIPAGRVKEELYYTAEVFRITGKVLGDPVNGYGSLDQAWITPGISWFASKGFLFFEDVWVVWANRYADGSTDYGVVIFGPENWNVCFYIDGGKAYTPKNNTIDIKWADERYPSKVDLALDNKTFQFEWNCERRLLEVKGMALWANGRMINLAKKEKPVEGYAWVEDIIFHQRNIPYSVLKGGTTLLSRLPNSLKSRAITKMFSKGLKKEK